METIIIIIANIIVTMIASLILKSFLPTYFSKKAENLATKEDIGKVTEEIKKVENHFQEQAELSKVERDFYNEMVEIINKFLSFIRLYEYNNGATLTKDKIKVSDEYTLKYQEFIDAANKILIKSFVFLKEENYILLRDSIKTEFSFNELANNLLDAMRKSIYKNTNLSHNDLRELKY